MADRVKLLDRLAERWLCCRFRWNVGIFRGARVRGLQYRPYRVLHSRQLMFRVNPKFDLLRIDEWERFGNSVMQLRNAIHVAERLGVGAIAFPEKHPFFSGEHAGRIALTWGVTQPTLVPSIEGRFFELDAFRLPMSAADAARIFSDHLRSLVTPELRIPDPRLRADDLVLHFRAGDVFVEEAHPSYGQPPLSYYLSAVEREQPTRVWLVFEDRSNPCIDAMEVALRERGIEVIVQSGPLAEDLRVLISARRIVASRGTFVTMIAHLSNCLTKIYYFGKGNLRPLRQLSVDVIQAKDKNGEFKATVLNGKWRNSPEQHALMMSYPAYKLTFEQLQ